jgi:hypothetical protein
MAEHDLAVDEVLGTAERDDADGGERGKGHLAALSSTGAPITERS